jgi:outer membrane protein assembly factor BamD (BamD/ComL family)
MKIFIVKNRAAILVLGAALFVSACASSAVNISEDLSPAELIQRAQEASDRNRYKTALLYYEALRDRNPSNIDLVCAAEYEIAFIHYKQKKYAVAKEEFSALLERYNTPDEELLPQQFKRLAGIVLERIAEKEKPKFPFAWLQKKGA